MVCASVALPLPCRKRVNATRRILLCDAACAQLTPCARHARLKGDETDSLLNRDETEGPICRQTLHVTPHGAGWASLRV